MGTYPLCEEAGTSIFPGNVEVGHPGVDRMKQCWMSSFGLRVDCVSEGRWAATFLG